MKAIVRILRATIPGTARVPGLSEETCRTFLAKLRREAPPLTLVGLYASALAVLVTPPLTIGRWRTADHLSGDDLDRHLQALARHPLYMVRQTIVMMKMTAGLAWGADPLVRGALGIAPYGSDPGTWRSA